MSTTPPNSNSRLGQRIAAVTSSLRCFVYSLVGLVPLVGIPFAVAAIVRSRQVQKASRADWNPADHYLSASRRLAPVSFLTSAIFLVLVVFVLPALWQDLGACSARST